MRSFFFIIFIIVILYFVLLQLEFSLTELEGKLGSLT